VLILSVFAESHTATLEGRVVLARKNLIGQTAGLNLNGAYFL